MQPYRSRQPVERAATVSFGGERWRFLRIVAAFLLVGASLAAIAGWFYTDGRISGSVLTPAIFGVLLLARTRSGTIELRHEEQELLVTFRRFGVPKRVRVPVRELTGVLIVPPETKDGEFELRLSLAGGKSVVLLRAATIEELVPSHEAVGDFLLENDLLRPPDAPLQADIVRVATDEAPPSRDETELLEGAGRAQK